MRGLSDCISRDLKVIREWGPEEEMIVETHGLGRDRITGGGRLLVERGSDASIACCLRLNS